MRRLFAAVTALLLIVGIAAAETVASEETIHVNLDAVTIASTKTVHIAWECGELPTVIEDGTPLKIVSRLNGFDDAEEIYYTWEINRYDGNGFVALPGENKSYLIVYATVEALGCDYRLIVEWR